jgi:hypothetical protein
MDPEKVTVTIVPSTGEDGALSVEDGMRQILDFFALLAAAGGEDASSISWQLVDVSMKSPLRATAVAVPRVSGVEAAPIARTEKLRLARSLDEIVRSNRVPDWMRGESLDRAKSFLMRNTNGVGRTEIQFYQDAPLATIVHGDAIAAIGAIQESENERIDTELHVPPWTEFGTIEGNVKSTTAYYGKPAIIVRERITGDDIVCVASSRAVQEGQHHTWAETWANKRVLVTGEIAYSVSGLVARVTAADFEIVDSSPISFNEIADPNFTGGLKPSEYLDSLWSDEVG